MAARVYFLVIQAEDGEHIQRFTRLMDGLHELGMQMGREAATLVARRSYVDDWGRRMRLEAWPAGTTVRDRRGYRRAYDAREYGTTTPAQRRLLAKLEGMA